VKTQAKTLERILVRKYTSNLSAFFHNSLSCELKRLTHVKNRIFPFVYAW